MTNLLQEPVGHRRTASWPASWGVVALAVAAATCAYLLAKAVGVDVAVEMGADPHHPVTVAAVITGSASSAILGVLVLQLALRIFVRGRQWWTIGAVAVMCISLVNPLAATGWQAWLTLTALHLVTGGVVIIGLRRIA